MNIDDISFESAGPSRLARVKALVAATTQAIKAKGVACSPTACVGALVTTLEAGPEVTTVEAIADVLLELLEQVPTKVVALKFDWLVGVVGATLSQHKTNPSVVSLYLRVSALLLCRLPPPALCSPLALASLYRLAQAAISPASLFRFDKQQHSESLDQDALVAEVVGVLEHANSAPAPHKGRDEEGGEEGEGEGGKGRLKGPRGKVRKDTSEAVGKAIREVLVREARGKRKGGEEGAKGKGEASDAVEGCVLLMGACVEYLTPQTIATLTPGLLKLPAQGRTQTTVGVFVVVRGVFTHAQSMPPMQLQLLMESTLGLKPDIANGPLVAGFVESACAGVKALNSHTLTQARVGRCVVEVLRVCLECFQTGDDQVGKRAADSAVDMLGGCSHTLASLGGGNAGDGEWAEIAALLQSCVELNCRPLWHHALRVVTRCLQVLQRRASPLLDSLVHSIACLWPLITNPNALPSHNAGSASPTTLRAALTDCIAAAIKALGPGKILQLLPLELDLSGEGSGKEERVWLLELLRLHGGGAMLGEFGERIVPLANRVLQAREEAKGKDKVVLAKHLEWRFSQLWALVGAYCNRPRDLKRTFAVAAKPLADTMRDQPLVTATIASALAALVRNALNDLDTPVSDSEAPWEAAQRHTPAEAQEALDAVRPFAKHLLPLFFTLYMTTANDKGSGSTAQALLEGVRQYARLGEGELLSSLLSQVLTKLLLASQQLLQSPDLATFQALTHERHALCDLVLALGGQGDGLGDEGAKLVLRVALPQIKEHDANVQKKSYRMLSQVVRSQREVVLEQLPAVWAAVKEALPFCCPASRAGRTALIGQLLQLFDDTSLVPMCQEVFVEIVNGVKESGKDSRDAAFDAILAMARAMQAAELGLDPLFQMFLAGLGAGNTHTLGAMLLGLARFAYAHIGSEWGEAMVDTLFVTIRTLLAHPAKEVFKGTLELLKVCLKAKSELVLPHLPPIVHGMFAAPANEKGRFLHRIKVVLERLGRKLTFEAVAECVPEEHRRLLTRVRKQYQRSRRKRSEKTAPQSKSQHREFEADVLGDDDDDEEGEEGQQKAARAGANDKSKEAAKGKWKPKRAKREDGQGVVLSEKAEPMDLLDSAAVARNLLSTKGKKRKANSDSGFKTAADGRMIVDDGDDDDKDQGRGDNDDADADAVDLEQMKEDREEVQGNKRRKTGAEFNRPSLATLKKQRESKKKRAFEIKHTGKEYRHSAKTKAKGDLKVAGKPDPFAYIPMSRLQLNKRYKHKVARSVRTVVTIRGKKKGN